MAARERAVVAAWRSPQVSPNVLKVAGLIVLLHGLRLVVSMNELAMGTAPRARPAWSTRE